jgi:hypothetical protein
MSDGHLYFHCPCFDGIVSAVLVSDFFSAKYGLRDIALHGVNYHLRGQWIETSLAQPSIVVDFLYHPAATFWADHHSTTFLTPQLQSDFERRADAMHVFDAARKSCARLLWNHLDSAFAYQNARFEELVRWADKTDSADYESPSEAISGDAPALQIVRGLGMGDDENHCRQLIRLLRRRSLTEAADVPAVRERYQRSVEQTHAGLQRIARAIVLDDDGIALFDVDGRGVNINRYAPFHFFPDARYSLGIIRSDEGAKITAMRNPWKDFPSVALGNIFEKVGGGGHQRVGSVVLRSEQVGASDEIQQRLLAEIKQAERTRLANYET